VPLIGRNYKPAKNLLVYATAENLSWLNKKDVRGRFETDYKERKGQ